MPVEHMHFAFSYTTRLEALPYSYLLGYRNKSPKVGTPSLWNWALKLAGSLWHFLNN